MNIPPPSIRSLVVIPALITLLVTGLRLVLELNHTADWLAGSEAGGGQTLLGITWLPFFFGPYFALRLRPTFSAGKGLYKRLVKTLLVYGLFARIPVLLIGIGAILGDWGTHYDKFPPTMELGTGGKIGMTFVAQLGLWVCVWTTLTGTFAAALVLFFRPEKST